MTYKTKVIKCLINIAIARSKTNWYPHFIFVQIRLQVSLFTSEAILFHAKNDTKTFQISVNFRLYTEPVPVSFSKRISTTITTMSILSSPNNDTEFGANNGTEAHATQKTTFSLPSSQKLFQDINVVPENEAI